MRDISERILAQKSQDELEQNRKLTTIIQGHIEDERRSLARELHDELGQYVSAIKIFAQNINNKSDGNKDIKTSASSVTSAANQIYDGMHNIIRKLRPGALDNLGLSETIRDTVSGWQQQHKNLKFLLNIKGKINDLGEAININIYRIIQESMNNALKHAKASEILIDLSCLKKNLKLEFSDNGIGFDKKILKNSKQFGLIGIKERVQSLKGTFELQTSLSNGVKLIILIPKGQ
jgi:glucose-6-phosphate-specific signal transduction histidine kinase